MYRRHFLQSSVALAAFSSCERHAITHEQSMAKIIDLICSGQAEAAHFLAYYRSRIAEVDSELRAVIELHPAPCASHQPTKHHKAVPAEAKGNRICFHLGHNVAEEVSRVVCKLVRQVTF